TGEEKKKKCERESERADGKCSERLKDKEHISFPSETLAGTDERQPGESARFMTRPGSCVLEFITGKEMSESTYKLVPSCPWLSPPSCLLSSTQGISSHHDHQYPISLFSRGGEALAPVQDP
ncbi:hypothetical protein Pcinc_030614, partial [Petrolisthes cinctipes]